MQSSREVMIDAIVPTAVKFAGETSLYQLTTWLFNQFAIVMTGAEVRDYCVRKGMYVTKVVKRKREVDVVRFVETSKRRRAPSPLAGLDISESVMSALDTILEPGEVMSTREAYGLLKQRFPDLQDATSNKLTLSLDESRYKVSTRTINKRSGRYLERVVQSV